MLWGMAPWLLTIAVVMLLVEFGKVRGFDAYEKVKLLGMGWGARIRNWFIHLNGRVVTAMLIAGIVMTSSLAAVHIRGADGHRTNHGIISRKMVTTAGVNAIRDALIGTFTLSNFKYHAAGTGTTAEATGDTLLVTEVESRVAGTQVSAGAGAYQSVATIPFTATRTITEHGLFSVVTSNTITLLDRSMFSGSSIGVVNGDSIQFTYTITFSAGG